MKRTHKSCWIGSANIPSFDKYQVFIELHLRVNEETGFKKFKILIFLQFQKQFEHFFWASFYQMTMAIGYTILKWISKAFRLFRTNLIIKINDRGLRLQIHASAYQSDLVFNIIPPRKHSQLRIRDDITTRRCLNPLEPFFDYEQNAKFHRKNEKSLSSHARELPSG